eukprot:624722-Pelagomonas_calceolata.AAC.1
MEHFYVRRNETRPSKGIHTHKHTHTGHIAIKQCDDCRSKCAQQKGVGAAAASSRPWRPLQALPDQSLIIRQMTMARVWGAHMLCRATSARASECSAQAQHLLHGLLSTTVDLQAQGALT